jgi:O-antigen/teichoic acid export membrane protein
VNTDTGENPNAFSFGRGILLGLCSSGWLAVLSVVLAPLYIRLLGIESYGLIGLYTAGLAVGGLLDVALSSTMSREISWKKALPAERSEISSLLRSTEIIYWLIVSTIVIGVLIAGLVYNPHWIQARDLSDVQVQGALVLMLISLGIQIPSGLYSASLIGLNQQWRSAAILGGFGTFRGLGAALVALSISSDIRVFFLFHVVVALIQLVVLRRQAWAHVKSLGGRPYFSIHSLASIRKPVRAMFFITLMGVLLSQGDKFIIALLLPLETLGHYSVAWALSGGLTILATPIYQGFVVKFSALAASNQLREFRVNVELASKLTYVLVVPLAIAISLFAESILLAWVRNADIAEASAEVLPLIVIGTMFIACTYPLLVAKYAKKEFSLVLTMQFVLLILFFPLLYWLVKISGIVGAALCWMLYGITMFTTYLIIVGRQHSRKLIFAVLRAFICAILVSLFVIACSKWFAALIVDYDILIFALALIASWIMLISGSSDIRQFIFGVINPLKLFKTSNDQRSTEKQ